MIDKKKIEEHVRGILEALGENPNREGLIDTPKRVANMYAEVFEGIQYSNDDIVEMYGKTFEEEFTYKENNNDMVVVRDIEIFSYCEHHLALMYNMKVSIAYIPKKKIIGLSKLARVSDMVGRRLQLQERIGSDILEVISKISETKDVAVLITGEHACMTTRGIKKTGTSTVTTTVDGVFKEDDSMFNRFLAMSK